MEDAINPLTTTPQPRVARVQTKKVVRAVRVKKANRVKQQTATTSPPPPLPHALGAHADPPLPPTLAEESSILVEESKGLSLLSLDHNHHPLNTISLATAHAIASGSDGICLVIEREDTALSFALHFHGNDAGEVSRVQRTALDAAHFCYSCLRKFPQWPIPLPKLTGLVTTKCVGAYDESSSNLSGESPAFLHYSEVEEGFFRYACEGLDKVLRCGDNETPCALNSNATPSTPLCTSCTNAFMKSVKLSEVVTMCGAVLRLCLERYNENENSDLQHLWEFFVETEHRAHKHRISSSTPNLQNAPEQHDALGWAKSMIWGKKDTNPSDAARNSISRLASLGGVEGVVSGALSWGLNTSQQGFSRVSDVVGLTRPSLQGAGEVETRQVNDLRTMLNEEKQKKGALLSSAQSLNSALHELTSTGKTYTNITLSIPDTLSAVSMHFLRALTHCPPIQRNSSTTPAPQTTPSVTISLAKGGKLFSGLGSLRVAGAGLSQSRWCGLALCNDEPVHIVGERQGVLMVHATHGVDPALLGHEDYHWIAKGEARREDLRVHVDDGETLRLCEAVATVARTHPERLSNSVRCLGVIDSATEGFAECCARAVRRDGQIEKCVINEIQYGGGGEEDVLLSLKHMTNAVADMQSAGFILSDEDASFRKAVQEGLTQFTATFVEGQIHDLEEEVSAWHMLLGECEEGEEEARIDSIDECDVASAIVEAASLLSHTQSSWAAELVSPPADTLSASPAEQGLAQADWALFGTVRAVDIFGDAM